MGNDLNTYRPNHSTITALIDVMDTWTTNIDKQQQNLTVFTDLSAAFDCVKHNVLNDKLKVYGAGPKTLQLVQSYLSHRSQMVTVNGTNSGWLSTKVGVPQGSILGPILFNIYVNELPGLPNINCKHKLDNLGTRNELFGKRCEQCGVFIGFADDSSLIFSGTKKDNNKLGNKIDHKLVEIEKFLGNNNLKMIVSKTELLRTTTRQQITWNKAETLKLQSLDENGLQIVPNKKAKILGVVFSDNLTWANHLETGKSAIIPNCKRKLGALKHTSNRASFKDKKRPF